MACVQDQAASLKEFDLTCSHKIEITYPGLSILQNAEKFEPQPIENSQQRHEPLPLIHDNAVTAHAFRDSLGETNFWWVSEAVGGRANSDNLPQSKEFAENERLANDMATLSTFVGTTCLEVVTYKLADEPLTGQTVSMIRVMRDTCFPYADRHFHDRASYNMTLQAFMSLERPHQRYEGSHLQEVRSGCALRCDNVAVTTSGGCGDHLEASTSSQ